MKITSEENELLLDLINKYDYPEFDAEKHVTANTLAQKIDITHRAAYDRLERMRIKGEINRERVRLPDGNRAWGYYRK